MTSRVGHFFSLNEWHRHRLPPKKAVINPTAGFTLFELLIAIVIILALTGVMFGFLMNVLNTRQRVREITAQQRGATTLIENIEQDLSTCLVGDAKRGAGVAGNNQHVRILSRSVQFTLADRPQAAADVLADMRLSTYRFKERSNSVTVSRQVAADEPTGPDESAVLAGVINKVRFRFHDGNQWVDSFNSLKQNRLPEAVEIAVWFDPWPGEEDTTGRQSRSTEDEERSAGETFDDEPLFDEREVAMQSDLDLKDEPPPDRLRVIIIPDAVTEDAAEGEAS